MAHDVFISHAAEDKILADAVCAALEAEGIRCWIAPRDVLAGRDWAESIVDALNEARVMVLIYSAKAADSPHVKKELTLGVGSGTVIVPLRIEDVPLTGMMQFYLMDTHWLDAMNPPSQHEIKLLVDTVKSLLHGASHLEMPPSDVSSDTVTDTSVTPPIVPDPENVEVPIVNDMTPPPPPVNPMPQPTPPQQQYTAPPAQYQQQYQQPAPQQQKSKKTLWIVLAIVGVLLLCCIGSLIVGVSAAKSLAYALKVPLVGTHHIEGHIHAVVLEASQRGEPVEYPALALVVSGGHTHLFEVREGPHYRLLGKTRDDAAGEAFDKVGKLMVKAAQAG